MQKFILIIIYCLFFTVNINAEKVSNDYEFEIEYEHDPMRPYLSSDKIALDTELKYAKCIRLQMGGYWDEIAKLYLIIANRGHPVAQLHLGKQYVHGNGVEEDYIEAYKWFSLSETAIGKHFIKVISEEMSEKQIEEAKGLVKNFKPVYK
ncbi:MAG: hypothetical protein CMJ06_02525 [Pelagibacterales bacterium]|nr:hypothetical protein [Pelagibacterales bacterium]OUU62927.1 MAG: hypothetical protein CBC22_02505 [Alphaproteobacteria bacterium TMED62]|tara:strand:- start:2963 stop:3412 length:450 start_codon:yes stop_codon:yes gene_type:complete